MTARIDRWVLAWHRYRTARSNAKASKARARRTNYGASSVTTNHRSKP